MMTAKDFVAAVEQIAAEEPVYRTGGSGGDGTCDCVGLLMGAMDRVEAMRFDLHSSNFFARREMETLEPMQAADLLPGMAVYKAREDNGSLNERYQPGGAYHNGDPLDYYHMGVLVTAEPLRIVHCTSSMGVNGIAWDSSVKGWTHAGRLMRVDYDEDTAEISAAYVQTDDGKPLKLRKTPDTKLPYIGKMPQGAAVELLADADGWAKVRWGGMTGYCMSQYLRKETQAHAQADVVTVTMERGQAQQLLDSLTAALGK